MDTVVVGVEELARKFNGLAEAMQGAALANSAKAGALVIQNAAKEKIQANGLMRTRTLSRSIHVEVTQNGADSATAEIGTNLEYAAIHEYGGTITPKNAKNLAIPVGNRTGSPRKYSDLKIRKTGAGNLVMVDSGRAVQYVLKKSVTIPARPYLRPAFDENQEKAKEVVADAFRKLIEKAAKA